MAMEWSTGEVSGLRRAHWPASKAKLGSRLAALADGGRRGAAGLDDDAARWWGFRRRHIVLTDHEVGLVSG